MTRILAGAVIAILCVAPGSARAEPVSAPQGATAPPYFLARPAPAQAPGNAADDASDYALREQAAPHLAEFSGGADGVYITSGAIAVALAIVLILVLI